MMVQQPNSTKFSNQISHIQGRIIQRQDTTGCEDTKSQKFNKSNKVLWCQCKQCVNAHRRKYLKSKPQRLMYNDTKMDFFFNAQIIKNVQKSGPKNRTQDQCSSQVRIYKTKLMKRVMKIYKWPADRERKQEAQTMLLPVSSNKRVEYNCKCVLSNQTARKCESQWSLLTRGSQN